MEPPPPSNTTGAQNTAQWSLCLDTATKYGCGCWRVQAAQGNGISPWALQPAHVTTANVIAIGTSGEQQLFHRVITPGDDPDLVT